MNIFCLNKANCQLLLIKSTNKIYFIYNSYKNSEENSICNFIYGVKEKEFKNKN